MTKESYQQCRKVMQRATWLLGIITVNEGNVRKWSHIVDYNGTPRQKETLESAKKKLAEWRKKFDELKLPASDIDNPEPTRCPYCGARSKLGQTVCENCNEML